MSIPDVSMQCQAEILQIALNKHTYFIVQYHKGVQVQTLDSNKADTWTLVLSYLLAWLHYHMQLVPSRPCLISLHSTAVCTMDFVAEACATITSSIINQKVLTAKPTYLYVRERVISTPSSPLHSKPWENPTHLYNQLSWICMWLLLLSSFSVLALLQFLSLLGLWPTGDEDHRCHMGSQVVTYILLGRV